MKKQCSNCEFNFGGICAGHGDTYQYGETIYDDTKCCNSWGASLEYYANQTSTAPRFLRDAHNDCRISYHEFSHSVDNFESGKPVTINIFDAIKHIYGISMVVIMNILVWISNGLITRFASSAGLMKGAVSFME